MLWFELLVVADKNNPSTRLNWNREFACRTARSLVYDNEIERCGGETQS